MPAIFLKQAEDEGQSESGRVAYSLRELIAQGEAEVRGNAKMKRGGVIPAKRTPQGVVQAASSSRPVSSMPTAQPKGALIIPDEEALIAFLQRIGSGAGLFSRRDSSTLSAKTLTGIND